MSALIQSTKLWLPIGLFCVAWIDLFRQLSYQWSTNEQYAYGYFVPFLAVALCLRRWLSRPEPAPFVPPLWAGFLLLILAATTVPLRLLHEVNPDWPLISWPLTIVLTLISLYVVLLMGGWAWLKHFAFPVCFTLVAVRWPYRMEHALTQNLMQVAASFTVEIIGWFGIPAFQRGNLIEISTGVLGVDEACSGIRSFQSTLMAALFLGELYRLRVWTRIVLVAGGLLLAFGFNICRTLILTWQANQHGLSAIDKWHDPAGFTIAIACFFVLWGMANLLKRKWGIVDPPLTGTKAAGVSQWSAATLPRTYMVGFAAWVACLVFGTELWFRYHENQRRSPVDWTLALPTSNAAFQKIELSQGIMQSLKSDTGEAGQWQTAAGSTWVSYYFRWRSGTMLSRIQARCHRPEVCLPASGRTLQRDLGTKVFNVHGVDLSFRSYIFDQQGQPLFVFFCLWEEGGENLPFTDKLTFRDRLNATLTAKRRLGQRTLEFIISGLSTLEEAEAAMQEELPKMITVQPSATAGSLSSVDK